MTVWDRAYDRLADTTGADSLGALSRRRRWRTLLDWFPSLSEMCVLDLGGTAESWALCPVQPRHVTLLNVAGSRASLPSWIDQQVGDACNLSPPFRQRSWDLVFSNSVIEHLGGHARRVDFADAVRELSPAHWVQTPYRYFPIEPHWLFPGFQFLPIAWRTAVSMRWPLYKWRSSDQQRALSEVLEIELISKTELASYFPDSSILSERVLGWTKSITAVRR